VWIAQFVATLFVCLGAVVLVPAAAQHDASQRSLFSNGCGLAAPASQAALSGGALAPDDPDSTDDDDDDSDDELPGGGMVLPGRPFVVTSAVVEFLPDAGVAVVRSCSIDSHSLRAPPQ
jgi:hypothetical protein